MSTDLATRPITGWAGFDQATGDDPHPLYARVRADGPVRPVVLADGRPAWIVTGYEEARQALLDPRLAKACSRR
jgi:cytochrome P450